MFANRTLAVSVAALALVAAKPCLAADEWLPLEEGTRWTYDRTQVTHVGDLVSTSKTGTLTCTVMAQEKVAGSSAFLLEVSGDAEHPYSLKTHVRCEAARITVARASEDELFIVPADFGASRSVKVEIKTADGRSIRVESTIADESVEIETALGKLSCRKVTAEANVGAVHTVRTAYYAKGTGLVKLVKHVETAGVRCEEVLTLRKIEHKTAEIQPAAPSSAERPLEAPAEKPAEEPATVKVVTPGARVATANGETRVDLGGRGSLRVVVGADGSVVIQGNR